MYIYIDIYIYIDFLNLNIPQLITYGCDNGCVMLYIHVYPGLMQGHEKWRIWKIRPVSGQRYAMVRNPQ